MALTRQYSVFSRDFVADLKSGESNFIIQNLDYKVHYYLSLDKEENHIQYTQLKYKEASKLM